MPSRVPHFVLISAIKSVAHLLPREAIFQLIRTNRSVQQALYPTLYSQLTFTGLPSSAYQALGRFLQVPVGHPGGLQVRHLDLSGLEERMYEDIPSTWLARLLLICPGLISIRVRSGSIFNDEAVSMAMKSKSAVVLSRLRCLDLSQCHSISSQTLQSIIITMPSLETLILPDSSAFPPILLTYLAQVCPKISWLDISRNHLPVGSLIPLALPPPSAKGAPAPLDLRHLDVSHTSIGDADLSAIGCRIGQTIESLRLCHCPRITIDGVRNLTKMSSCLRTLDISECVQIGYPVVRFLATNHHLIATLERLSLSYTSLGPRGEADLCIESIGDLLLFTHLRSLHISDLPPRADPDVLKHVATHLPQLRRISFHREYIEDDYLLWSYTDRPIDPYAPPPYTDVYGKSSVEAHPHPIPHLCPPPWYRTLPWMSQTNVPIHLTFTTTSSSPSSG